MCCFFEVAMSVWGIITLATGKFTISRDKVVTGAPAYVIGGILLLTLPIPLSIGFVIGFVSAVNTGQQPDVMNYLWIDPAVVLSILAIVGIIAFSTAKPPVPKTQQFAETKEPLTPMPPTDPNNPYQSPHFDSPSDRPRNPPN